MYEALSFNWCSLGQLSTTPVSLSFLQFVSSCLASADSDVLQ